MQTFRDGMFLILQARALRRLAIPALLLSLFATPLTVGLYARDRDKPEKEAKAREKEKHRDKSDKQSRSKDKDRGKEQGTVARKEDDAARLAGSDLAAAHPLTPVLETARGSRDAIRKIPGYTCTFIKQEQFKKGPPLRQVMTLKFRREPFSVYLKYIEPHAGREVIYVDGRNKGKLQVHEPSGLASVVGTISLSPTGGEAMKENRYPVTMIGMEKVLDTAISDWELALKHPEVQVEKYPQAKVGDFECKMFEVVYPQPHEPFKFHKARVYFDKKTQLPVRTEQYGFPAKAGEEAPLLEEYTYADLNIDVPIADSDFDVNNAAYGFK
ncbi:MAG: DUF1571 domain-containing protein [Deltaproteobacteria bacterium]